MVMQCPCLRRSYRDRRVERQRRWPEALSRRLITLPFRFFPLKLRDNSRHQRCQVVYIGMPLNPSISASDVRSTILNIQAKYANKRN